MAASPFSLHRADLHSFSTISAPPGDLHKRRVREKILESPDRSRQGSGRSFPVFHLFRTVLHELELLDPFKDGIGDGHLIQGDVLRCRDFCGHSDCLD